MKFYLLLLVCQPWFTSCLESVVVSTKYGKLRGASRDFDKSIGLGNVSKVNKFLGVPFAAHPTGDLRFRPPVKPKKWKGVRDATKFKPLCYQDPEYNLMFWSKDASLPEQSDDCLYLNIYTPNTSAKIFYPVMVYIHGGGYEAGSPAITPGDVVPLWDVVLVTIQYRLGPFGFFSTGDSTSPGNYGMLDQIESLKWIKENIRVFKGDPSRVTIFGESAGGASVGLHLLSPLSKDLFHSAIPISGSDLSPFAVNTHKQALRITLETAKKFSCPTQNNENLIKCMRQIKASEIHRLTKSDTNVWRPVVDGSFLHDTPKNLRMAKKFHPFPVLVGVTSDEGSFFLGNSSYYQLSVAPFTKASFATYDMFLNAFERPHEPIAFSPALEEALAFQYTPWPDSSNEEKLRKGLIDLISDYSFTAPAHAVLEHHSSVGSGYLFVFSHQSKLSAKPSWKGAAHKDDTPYEFGFPLMNLNILQDYDEQDRNVSQIIITLFTNFARTHNPTPQPLRGCVLPRFSAFHHAYINITAKPSIESNFHRSNVAFWNKYFPKLRKNSHCKSATSIFGSTSGSSDARIAFGLSLVSLFAVNSSL